MSMNLSPDSTAATLRLVDLYRPTATPRPAAAARPPVTELALPSVDQRWAYVSHYAGQAVRSIVGRHELHPERCGRYVTVLRPAADVSARWSQTFGADVAARPAFLYAQSAGTLLYMQLFTELGLNLRHLLHVRHETTGARLDVAGPQRVTAELCSLSSVGRSKVLVVLASTVEPLDGGEAIRVEDHFLVRAFDDRWTAALAPANGLVRALRLQQTLEAQLPQDEALSLEISAELGGRFARLSGDMNPVHTNTLGARLARHPKPFVQGLCTRNLVAAAFSRTGLALTHLSMDFCRPVYVAQTVRFAHDSERFEIVDAERKLLARGRFESSRPAPANHQTGMNASH